MLDIDLEILHNKIDKIKIKIPWKHLRSEVILYCNSYLDHFIHFHFYIIYFLIYKAIKITVLFTLLLLQPIQVSIEGFSLSLKQCYQQNEKEKNDNSEKLQKLKDIALQKFDKDLNDRKNDK